MTGVLRAGGTEAPPTTPALRLRDVSKSFGPVHALKGVSLEIGRNEVVGIVGENGAGKSTLLKILTGLHRPDTGLLEVDGTVVHFSRPQDALAAGIGVVHQEQSLLPNLTVAENVAINVANAADRAVRFGWYRWSRLHGEAEAVLARVGSRVDPRSLVSELSFVDRQMVEIARALRIGELVHAAPLLILDEPTAVLEPNETEIVEQEIRRLKSLGSIIFVSHRLDEVRRICDRIVVMRHGEVVADRRTEDVTEAEIFRLMIGHDASAPERTTGAPATDAPVLRVDGLTRRGVFQDISLAAVPGRCLAVVGSIGSGREEVCRALFGAVPFDAGTLEVDGRVVRAWSVRHAVRHGIGYVPSERKVEGMVGGLSSAENLTLGSTVGRRRKAGRVLAAEWFERLDVRPNDPGLRLDRFSGGNQQKVVMAKWLTRPGLRLLILDHPLRGLDPGAAATVNEQIRAACASGAAVVMVPDTIEEALELGHDIVVMRDGRVTACFDVDSDAPTAVDLLERMV